MAMQCDVNLNQNDAKLCIEAKSCTDNKVATNPFPEAVKTACAKSIADWVARRNILAK